jgi:hypothetical protein
MRPKRFCRIFHLAVKAGGEGLTAAELFYALAA